MSKRKGSVNLNVYVNEETMEKLNAYCRSSGRTKTVVTERALAAYLEGRVAEKEGGYAAVDDQ